MCVSGSKRRERPPTLQDKNREERDHLAQSKFKHLFRNNSLEKKTADRIRRMETMAACWKILDTFFDHPMQFARDLMAKISAFKRIQNYEYEKLLEYYFVIQANIDKAKNADLLGTLLQPQSSR
jgi:hypothetical protein